MKASPSVSVFGTFLLIGNVMGITAFVLHYWSDINFDGVTALTSAGYAVAIIAAMIGAVLLLLRQPAATTMFLLSLVAVIVQLGFTLVGTDLLAQHGFGAIAFIDFIITMGILQLLFARPLVAKARSR